MSAHQKGKVTQSCLTLCSPMDHTVHGILQARILEWVAFSSSRGSSQPGIKPRSPALQVDSLPAEPQGKPKNTEVGSLSILQGIFPIEKSNQGLLHCRQVLYQLSNQGSPAYQSTGSMVVVHRLSCSMTCGNFLDQGLNLCLQHWREDSLPLSHQGIPALTFLKK